MPDSSIPTDPEIDSVLTAQLGELGAKSSLFGAGGHGARWSAKRLKTETAHEVIDVPRAEHDRILATLNDSLSGGGTSATSGPSDDSVITTRGIVGSGFASMNPAYVIIVVDRQSSTVGIAAHAKEGLIKQRTAQKAVDKVRARLGI